MASRSEDSFILLGGDNRTSEIGRSAKLDTFNAVRLAPDSSKVPTNALTSEALSALQHTAPSTGGTDNNVDWVNDHHSIATSAIHSTIEDAGESANALDGSAATAVADRGPSEAELHHWDRQAANGNITMCACKFPVHANIMVYGESGLGKTTCIRNLIGKDSSWKIKHQGAAFGPAAGSPSTSVKTSLQQFKDDSDSLRIELEPVWDGQSNMELHFSFQDMPGWSDSINPVDSLKTVVEFLLHQRQMDYVSNRAGQTDCDPLPGAKMTRGITVCLYFLPPHSVKTIDWVMMAAISKLVAVVPVIAKADTFTPRELEEFRREILQVINHSQPNAITGGQTSLDPPGAAASSPAGPDHPHVRLARDLCLQTYSFRKSDLDQVGASGQQVPPFAIVSSKDVLTTEQARQFGGEPGDPCRAYSWGTVFPYDRRHSSLLVLKQLLCGHRNAAIHDLLRDSWTRACTFAKQFEQQLATKGVTCMYGSVAGCLPCCNWTELVR